MRVGKLHTAVIAGALAATGVLGVATPALAQPAPASAVQQQAAKAPRGTLTSTVAGTFTDATGGSGVVDGTFKPTRFIARQGKLLATGSLTANLVDSAGKSVGTTTRTVTVPVVLPAQDSALAQADCRILNLVLGPLDLDLLGLQVHLDRVVLDITAQSGSGNLLGNLLCAVAGLLDGGGSLGAISALLNSILGLLRL